MDKKNFYRFIILTLPLILFCNVSILAQEVKISTINNNFSIIDSANAVMQLSDFTGDQKHTVLAQEGKILPVNKDSSVTDTANEYMPLSEFTWDHDLRYTMDGSLPRLKTQLNPIALEIIGASYVTAIVGLHVIQLNAWWNYERRSFHAEEAWAFGYQANIAGHAFGGYVCSYVMSEGLITSGFSVPDATLYGTLFGALYQSYVEIEDGFSKAWGWSPSEAMANLIGPIFFLAQHHVPALQYIQPKWQYIPTEWTGEPNLIDHPAPTFIDDYDSSSFWWSVDIYNLLPDNLKKYWLNWLSLALGYGSDGVASNPNPNGPPDQEASRRVIIGLDYNLDRLLPDGPPFWNWFKQSLNLIKFPSPGVEFGPNGTRFSLFYPFKIDLGGLKF
jgi:hypothetical protein